MRHRRESSRSTTEAARILRRRLALPAAIVALAAGGRALPIILPPRRMTPGGDASDSGHCANTAMTCVDDSRCAWPALRTRAVVR